VFTAQLRSKECGADPQSTSLGTPLQLLRDVTAYVTRSSSSTAVSLPPQFLLWANTPQYISSNGRMSKWIMTWRELWRKWLWLNRGCIPEFAWRDYVKPWKTLVMPGRVPHPARFEYGRSVAQTRLVFRCFRSYAQIIRISELWQLSDFNAVCKHNTDSVRNTVRFFSV
jgi:hypothetical protein